MATLDFDAFDVLTFDCYGTLIDWERGILKALQPVLVPHGIQASEDDLLVQYASHESRLEAGANLSYREILARSLRGLCADLGVDPSDADIAEFSESVAAWPAFTDSAAALRELAERFKLGVITNCDDDLFASSSRRLGVSFDWVVSAQAALEPGLGRGTAILFTSRLPGPPVQRAGRSQSEALPVGKNVIGTAGVIVITARRASALAGVT